MSTQKSIKEEQTPVEGPLREVIQLAIHQAMATHASTPSITNACKVLLPFLWSSANSPYKVSLSTFYKVFCHLSLFIPQEERSHISPLLRRTLREMKRIIRQRRDPYNPLFPHRILPFSMHQYCLGEWYIASFIFDDPVVSGTTSDTHFAYIKVPKSIMTEGEDFDLNFFYSTHFFKGKQVVLRIHSECILGDMVISQTRCDCGWQLQRAMEQINRADYGILL